MGNVSEIKVTSDSGITILSENGFKGIEKKEVKIERGVRITCKSCNFKFFLSDENAGWYKSQNMCLPLHCWHCRKARKSKNEKVNGEA